MQRVKIIEYPQEIKIAPNSCAIFIRRPIIEDNRTKGTYWAADMDTTSTTAKKQMPSNITDGKLSLKAASRLKQKIKYLFWLSGCFRLIRGKYVLKTAGKISFLTLSLSYDQIHSDTFIKANMLNQFITQLRQRYGNFLYIWRAEKQTNGNIHFHFLINKFIPWEIARRLWNQIQRKEGYIQLHQHKFRGMWFEEYIKTIYKFNIDKLPKYRLAYNKGVANDWSDPNSIDIISVKDSKQVYHYIAKYLSSNEKHNNLPEDYDYDKLLIEGRNYYCCSELTAIVPDTHFIDSKIMCELDLIYAASPDHIIVRDFFTVIILSIEELYNLGCKHLHKLFILSTKQLQL